MGEEKWIWEEVGGSRDGLIRTYRKLTPDGILYLTTVKGDGGVSACAQTFVIDELDETPIRAPAGDPEA